MIEVRIDNLAEVQNLLRRAERGLGDNRYLLMRQLAGTMHTAVQKNFRQGGRPKWLGLKYRNGKPLLDTGALRSSINQTYDNDTAIVGTNLVYAAIHHFGGMAGRNRKVAIPARPFMTLSDADTQQMANEIQAYFANLIR